MKTKKTLIEVCPKCCGAAIADGLAQSGPVCQACQPPAPVGLWVDQFGAGFAVPELITALFEDISYSNDLCPSFRHRGYTKDQETEFQLFVDHPIDAEREHPGKGSRFFICRYDGQGCWVETTIQTDDLIKAVTTMGKLDPTTHENPQRT